MNSETFEAGLKIRREIAGAALVDQAFADPDDFARPMQELVTEYCFGAVWSRPGLDRRMRSFLNIAMLAALNRPDELAGHIKGAITNGVTKEEISETLLQVAVYCGVPAGMGGFKIAKKVFADLGI